MFKRWISLPKGSSLVLGPRRAGKTTFLKTSFPDYQYVTLDDLDILSWANRDAKGLVESFDAHVIVDEVQRAPHLTVALKKRIDEKSITAIMTGSSSLGLLDATADSLAGRIHIVHFPTACWGEDEGSFTHSIFTDRVSPPEMAAAQRLLSQALMFGGFPEVLTLPTPQEKEQLLKTYRDTYFTRDLAQLSNIENIEGILAILHHCAQSIGSLVEISNFAQEAGLSHPTAKKYLNVLTQSELVFKLYGYHLGTAKRYVSSAKLYFCDSGLPTSLPAELSKGQRVENFVISELEKRRKLGFYNAEQLFYYRSASKLEIDMILEEKNALSVIEIKASDRISSGDLRNLKDYLLAAPHKKVKGYLFYTGTEYIERDGISCIPIAAIFRGR